MLKVWLAQLKCPANHCVLAGAGVYASEQEARALERQVLQGFELLVREGKLIRECGICKSTTLAVQLAPTRFRTMLEAQPYLRAAEASQIASMEFVRKSNN